MARDKDGPGGPRDPRDLRDTSGGAVVVDFHRRRNAAFKHLPEGRPFEPVGVDGDTYYVIDANCRLRAMKPRDMSRNGISSLCGAQQAWLLQHFPRARLRGKGPPDSFRPEAVADALMAACSEMGVWSPLGRVRGRGWWLDQDGELVVHLGDKLLIRGRLVSCGRQGEYVYDVRPRLPRPAMDRQPGGPGGPGQRFLDLLASFRMRRGDLDRRLLLGMLVCMVMSGALDFCPHLFLTGDRGTGKSTLLTIVRLMLAEMLVQSSDTTAAGLYQQLRHDLLALLLDELENDPDPIKAQKILAIGRTASTGGWLNRGGADHEGMSVYLHSCILAAAIIMPAMRVADHSRWVQVDVMPLQARPGEPPPMVDLSGLPELGRALFRRAIEQWGRFRATVLPRWREALMRAGWDSRGADLYGTLLAAGCVALHDETPADEMADLIAQLEGARLQHKAEETPEWRRCADHSLGVHAEPFRRGERRLIGSMLLEGTGYGRGDVSTAGLVDPSRRSPEEAGRIAGDDHNALDALNGLAAIGIRVMHGAFPQLRDTRGVAFANNHPGLFEVFKGTHWGSVPGVSGPWRHALLRAPEAYESKRPVRFKGRTSRAVVLPLECVLAGLVGSDEEGAVFRDHQQAIYRPEIDIDPGELH
jgi:hypothetical protein